MKDKDTHIGNLKAGIREKENHIANIDATLNNIYNSHGWKALLSYNRLRDKIFPLNTKRRVFAIVVFRILRNPLTIFRSLRKDNIKRFFYYLKNAPPSVLGEKIEKRVFTGKIKIYCDRASMISNAVEVTGWAIAKAGIERIEIFSDGILLGRTSCAHPRSEVHKAFPQIKNSLNSGYFFYTTVDKEFRSGDHTLLIRATSVDGETIEITEKITVMEQTSNYLLKTMPSRGTLNWMRKSSEKFCKKPRIGFVIPLMEGDYIRSENTINSIVDQSYPFWNISLFCHNESHLDFFEKYRSLMDGNRLKIYSKDAINETLRRAGNDFICFMDPGSYLMPNSLFEFVTEIKKRPHAELIYSDEITLNGAKKELFFKPDWSPELFAGMDYIGQSFILKVETLVAAGGVRLGLSQESVYDLLFRVTERATRIIHLPSPLFCCMAKNCAEPERVKIIINDAMIRAGIQAEVLAISGRTFRVTEKTPRNAVVSIIIPTAYKNPEKFESCIRSIAEKSSFRNYEILIMDNSLGKLSLDRIRELIPESIQYRCIKYDEQFNFSRINNVAATQAKGDYLIFLNDDTEIISSDWIEAMLEYAQDPKVGVVGAKLLYPDGTIQHGGVFLVDHGGAGRHFFRLLPDSRDYWNGLSGVARNCSAVTFACAMVSKSIFSALEGLDEELVVECNDVDFCLRAGKAGYRVVWTPFATVYHKELTSRQSRDTQGDVLRHWSRWRHIFQRGDPYYNPNLSLDSDTPSLNLRPILIEHHEPYLQDERIVEYHKFAEMKGPIDKILVIKLDHIGDLILSLPAVKMLRSKFPKAHITMLVGKWAKFIAENVPEIDRVMTFDFFHGKSENGRRDLSINEKEGIQKILRENHFDIALDLRKAGETREIMKLSGARYAIGYHTCADDDWLSISLKMSAEIEDIPFQITKLHITDQLCQLVQAIPAGNLITGPNPELPLFSLATRDENFDAKLTQLLPPCDLLVGIHPGAGSAIRQWPASHYARLADLLVEKYNAGVVLFGSKDESDLTMNICEHATCQRRIVSLAGKVSLEELMAMTKYLDLFIGNVSGPCHIAGVSGVPTLMIFAGQVLPHEWHPLGDKTLSIRMGIQCAPCYKSHPELCPFDLKCLKFLWPEKVMEGVRQLLAISGNSPKKYREDPVERVR